MKFTDLEGFGSSPIGDLVAITGHDARFDRPYRHSAFVPHPLPMSVALSPETLIVMSEADRALGHINARVQFLPTPSLLVAHP